ncbi:hypothetical protein QJ854_gp611 [Moumouvirus goulette]|uniref:Uncharacterized protein n=1 Tax=Moumouvirus goulette TaxID=1247379 RepID=M1PMI2_9VIRU|nr:hypothetical protein QJ854_gp611 [Moumouvirus goulette]AGF85171.1 hypothetical protein glt_00362 [Moumouvirus goulette]
MDSDIKYFIQEINNKCYILAYEFYNTKSDIELNNSNYTQKYKNQMINFVVVKKYDEIKNNTRFEIFCLDNNSEDLTNIFHDLIDNKYIFIDNNHDILSFPVVGEEELYSIIKKPECGEIFILKKYETFVLFEIKNIDENHTNHNFIELLKKIYNDYFFIVLKTSSDMVYYNEKNETIENIYKYVIYFNNKSIKNMETRFYYNIFGSNNFIIFESHKDFKDLFSNGVDPDKHDYEKYIDNYSDTDTDSD